MDVTFFSPVPWSILYQIDPADAVHHEGSLTSGGESDLAIFAIGAKTGEPNAIHHANICAVH